MNVLSDPRRSVALWAVCLGLLASQVAQGHVREFDLGLTETVAALRSPGWEGPMHAVTFFGSSAWTLLALAALACLGWRRARASILVFFAAFAFGLGLEAMLRVWVMQWRPDVAAVPESADLITAFRLTGFPSGHAYKSAFLFGWIARELGRHRVPGSRLWQGICLAVILPVGFSRLYLNRHWASDVLGGWLVALLALAIAAAWERAFEKQSVVRRP